MNYRIIKRKMAMQRARRTFFTLLPAIAFLSLNLLSGYLCSMVAGDSVMGTILGNIVTLCSGGFWYRHMRERFHAKTHLSLGSVVFFVSLVTFVWVGTQLGSNALARMFPQPMDAYMEAVELNPWGYLFLSLIVAPLSEELLFRGIFYTQLRKLVGPVAGCLVSSALFSIVHPTPSQVYLAFVCGLVFCASYEVTDNMAYCMMLHGGYNFLSIFVGRFPDLGTTASVVLQAVMWVFVGALFLKVSLTARREDELLEACRRG